MNSEGWFSIHRKLISDDLWLNEKFTRGQAWVDLIGLANHKKGSILKRGIIIDVERGQVGWSEVRLASRWKWSRTKTKNFLKWLEKEQQIKQDRNFQTLVITIINYDKYQKENSKKNSKLDSKRAAEEQQKDTNNNNNNENNNINNRVVVDENVDNSGEHVDNLTNIEGMSNIGSLFNQYQPKESKFKTQYWQAEALKYIEKLKIINERDKSTVFRLFKANTDEMISICSYILESSTPIENPIGYILYEKKRRKIARKK